MIVQETLSTVRYLHGLEGQVAHEANAKELRAQSASEKHRCLQSLAMAVIETCGEPKAQFKFQPQTETRQAGLLLLPWCLVSETFTLHKCV